MGQSPSFFAKQLTNARQLYDFWFLVNEWGFSGESALCKVTIDGCTNMPFPLVTMQKAG